MFIESHLHYFLCGIFSLWIISHSLQICFPGCSYIVVWVSIIKWCIYIVRYSIFLLLKSPARRTRLRKESRSTSSPKAAPFVLELTALLTVWRATTRQPGMKFVHGIFLQWWQDMRGDFKRGHDGAMPKQFLHREEKRSRSWKRHIKLIKQN